MDFSTGLIEGVLIRRYKRFFADVALPNGETVVAHCPNTGAMTGCAEPGFNVWISRSNNPKRKLKYTWELAKNNRQQWIGVNTGSANKLVEEALHNKIIEEVAQYSLIKREHKPEGSNSRFDFLLTNPQTNAPRSCLLEVKSVTLCEGNIGYFPDAVTTRGTKHCLELADQISTDVHCVLLFCIQHSGIEQLKIAQSIDPDYTLALHQARRKGVTIIAYQCDLNDKKILLNQSLPIVF